MAITGDVLAGDTATVGDVVITRINRNRGNIVQLDWVCSAGGVVTATIAALTGTLMRVVTDPDAVLAPDDNYNIVLNGPDGFDVFNGGGALRDTLNSEAFTPFMGDGTFGTPMTIDGLLTLGISAAGVSEAGSLRLYIKPSF